MGLARGLATTESKRAQILAGYRREVAVAGAEFLVAPNSDPWVRIRTFSRNGSEMAPKFGPISTDNLIQAQTHNMFFELD
jgi:hypothetical protein